MSVWRRGDGSCMRGWGPGEGAPKLGSKEPAQAVLKPTASCLEDGIGVVREKIRVAGFPAIANNPNSVSQ